MQLAVNLSFSSLSTLCTNATTVGCTLRFVDKKAIQNIVGILAKDVKSKIGSFDLMVQYCKLSLNGAVL